MAAEDHVIMIKIMSNQYYCHLHDIRCEWYGAVLGDGDHNCGPGIGTMDEVGCCRDGPAGDENEQ